MKKTLTANISGTVFHIEEDAYTALQRYLASIRSQFDGSEGCDEIMADIEARIAELFTERLDGQRQVVSTADVEHVIGIMGQPEDYASEEQEHAEREAQDRASWSSSGSRHKRLFRDPDDKWVGGVLGGVGAYFNINPLTLRLIYLLFLFVGFGFLLYIILWIVVPKAETAAEKLSMRGEEVNVENLKRQFSEGADRFEKGARKMAEEAQDVGRRYAPKAQHGGQDVLNFLGQALRMFITAFGKLIGVAFLAAGAFFAIVMMVAMIGRYDLMMNSTGMGDGPDLQLWTMLLFDTPAQATWMWAAVMVFFLIPVIGLLYGGIHLLFDVKAPKWFGLALAPIWIASIVVLSFVGARFGSQFRSKEVLRTITELQQPEGQTLILANMDKASGYGWDHRFDRDLDLVSVEGDSVQLGWADLDVRKSSDDRFHLVVERRARGYSRKEASHRAQEIRHAFEQVDSTLRLSPWYRFHVSNHFRGQLVHLIVEVPIGKAVYFDRSVRGMMNDIDNVSNTWDSDMVGRTWTMTPNGLSDRIKPEDLPDDLRPPAPAPASVISMDRTEQRKERKNFRMPDLWALMRPSV